MTREVLLYSNSDDGRMTHEDESAMDVRTDLLTFTLTRGISLQNESDDDPISIKFSKKITKMTFCWSALAISTV